MIQIGVCGHFGKDLNLSDGQTIKTKTLTKELKNKFGENEVITVDTYGWKINPLKLLLRCIWLIKNCKSVIILPGPKGIKIFIPLFLLLNKMFNSKMHYVVIGGWLPDLTRDSVRLKDKLLKLDGIYIETYSMIEDLKNMGLRNVYYLPNFKSLSILKEKDLVYSKEKPYKLCTFSRVSKEKGIENAVAAVKKVNETLGYYAYELDIYGQVDAPYVDRFKELREKFPQYISYKGVVPYEESVNTLKNYFALLFPTYYEGEGFAGTIIDAFAAGVPVIATNWRYNGEIINHLSDGLIYDYRKPDQLKEILIKVIDDETFLLNMKKHCIERAKEYEPDNALRALLVNLEV